MLKHLSLTISLALCAFAASILTSRGGGGMDGYANMGRAILSMIVGGISGVLLLLHAIVVAVNLHKGNQLSPIYYVSIALAALPGTVVGVLALMKRL